MIDSITDAGGSLLLQAAMDTFEKLAFIFSYPEENETTFSDADSEPVGAVLSFNGPFTGKMALLMSEPVLQELADNMLGLDEDLSADPRQCHDALGEALNIICGNFLPAFAGEGEIFHIGAPNICDWRSISSDAGEASQQVIRADLTMENGTCRVLFSRAAS